MGPAGSGGAGFLSRRDGELLRSGASFVVVTTHCVHAWVKDFYATHDFLSLGFLATLLDQFSRFTVPAFFLLSGYALTRQHLARPLTLREYYRRRLPNILLPFLLWSAISSFRHWGFFGRLPWAADPVAAVGGFLEFLFLTGFDYQYYFLIVIFQFYLVFPLLVRFAGSRWFLAACLLPQLALMSPFESWLALADWRLPRLYSNLLVFYGFYCAAGMHAAWNPRWLSGLCRALTRPQAWFLWLGAFALIVAEYWVNIGVLGKKMAHADHFNRWVVPAYCAASLILLLKHRGWLLARFHAAPRWQFLYALVTPYSFFVYLAHTHVLRLADLFLTGRSAWIFAGRILFVAAGSYALAWAAAALLRNAPGWRRALALPREIPPFRLGVRAMPGRGIAEPATP